MKKIIIGAALAACLSVNVFGYDRALQNLIDSEFVKMSMTNHGEMAIKSIESKYFKDKTIILDLADKNISDFTRSTSIKGGIKTHFDTFEDSLNVWNWDEKQFQSMSVFKDKPDLNTAEKANLFMNQNMFMTLYVPSCKDNISKTTGDLLFSKKFASGIGKSFSNQNYCTNFSKYLLHLQKSKDELKYSYATFMSRNSSYVYEKNKKEPEIKLRAMALEKTMEYGSALFNPMSFMDVFVKNNFSTTPKIGGKDEELEQFIVFIMNGSFRNADDILERNIKSTEEIFEYMDNYENIKEVVINNSFIEIPKDSISNEDLQYVYNSKNNECILFKDYYKMDALKYIETNFNKNMKVSKYKEKYLAYNLLDNNKDIVVFKDKFECELVFQE